MAYVVPATFRPGQPQPVDRPHVVPANAGGLARSGHRASPASFCHCLGSRVVGIVLSWVGFAQAKREGRPSGLCLAGILIGLAWVLVVILFYAVLVGAVNSAIGS